MQHTSVIFFTIALILGGFGAWIMKVLGGRIGLLDVPNERSSHRNEIPKGGGVGILAAFVFVSVSIRVPLPLWLPASFLALLSFFADRFDFSPKLRLCVQFGAAFCLMAGMKDLFYSHIGALALFFALAIFIVATANFCNFMDGINGIAAITGIVGYMLLALYMEVADSDSSLSSLAVGISFACLGFLPFNLPKARVFMGDVGSILLGFVFGSIVLFLSRNLLDFVCLSSFLFPFYADELTTMVVRLNEGENLLRPHRRHIYQLLANEMGIVHWKISLSYGAFQLIVGLSVLLLMPYGLAPVISLLVFFISVFSIYGIAVRKKVAVKGSTDLGIPLAQKGRSPRWI